jgi:hypothetical protein
MNHIGTQIVLFTLRHQNLRLLRQARHVCETSGPTARTPAYEALLRLPVERLRTDVARLALRVVGARLRRDHYGLRIPLVCIVLFGAACFLYFFAELVVPAFFPMLRLAFRPTVACAAAAAFLAQR